MEPNVYQKKALSRLREFLRLLEAHPPAAAYLALWGSRDVSVDADSAGGAGMPPYRDTIAGVPHVCFKVPTGGGKTFLAACAIRYIKEATVQCGEGAVAWLVPSDSILEQTLANLKNADHPYRRRLQKDFPAGVEIYSKEQLINGQNFLNLASVQEHLSVFVLSYDSFRANKKEGLRAYRENERLRDFPVSGALPGGADESSLVNAINVLNPIVVVDESHHAAGKLSIEMLRNFNPRFILDLTATPRENSNIIAFAEAGELKKANMVKLPLIVFNRHDKNEVMADAIRLRARIEKEALAGEADGGGYIRPIVLFQAQPRGKEDAATFQKLKEDLVDCGIPKEEIAVKTADVNELKNTDLLSRDCPIRYIITVNALKEGWDCPFAYILATLANKTSKVDVEQIVGRVLRQPYAVRHSRPELNNAYVLTCSNEFTATLDGIVRALNDAGFSRKDVRVAEEKPQPEPVSPGADVVEPAAEYGEEFLGDYTDAVRKALSGEAVGAVEDMINLAAAQTEEYEREAEESEKLGYLGGLEGGMKNQYKMREVFRAEAEGLCIPQFCIAIKKEERLSEGFVKHGEEGLPEGFTRLYKENLSAGFSLKNADSNVNFSLAGGAVYAVDAAAGGGATYRKMTPGESEHLRHLMERGSDDKRRKICVDLIVGQLERKIGDEIPGNDIRVYVEHVADKFSDDDLAAMQTGFLFYANRIIEKIESLLSEHREIQFFDRIDIRNIVCRPMFKFSKIITPSETLGGLEKSLYECEAAVNGTERKVIEEVAALPNVRWWHRVAERKDYSFCVNGFINHYPDFLVMTDKGTLAAVEVKGGDRDNSDSERKLRLGRKWADKAGDQYRYYMVFDNLEWNRDGAFDMPRFVELMREL